MDKSNRFLLIVLTALITTLIVAVLFRQTSNIANAASLFTLKSNQLNTSLKNKLEAPVTDLVVDAMEVTQSVQDMNGTVPLVMGKRTFVRVYTHSTNGTWPTTATLGIQLGGFHTSLLPIAPGGPFINVRQSYNRLLSGQAFLFEIPLLFTFSNQVTLTAMVNPAFRWHPHNPEEFTYTNNSITTTVSFAEIPPLYLVIASQPYTFNNIKFTPTVWDTWNLAYWIQRAYPVSQMKVYFRTLPTINAQRIKNKNGDWDLVVPNCAYLNDYLAYNRASILGSPFYPNDTAFYGMVADTAGFMRGCSQIGGLWLGGINNSVTARVASGPSGPDDWGWDFDGTYADWYGGHELGHAFGLPHTKGGPGYVKDGCGGEAGSWKVYPDGRISPTLNFSDPTAMFGFDSNQLYVKGNPVLSPWWHDMMTYCDYNWISGYDYTVLENTFKYQLPLAQSSKSGQPNTQDVLAIFGTIDKSTRQLTLQPISILYAVPDVLLPSPGNYAIVLRDASNNELARYPFTPSGLENGQSPDPSLENQYAYISELVPYVVGTTSVRIEGPVGDVLAQVNAGIEPPTVQVTSPIRGEIEDGSTVTVTWTASDPNNDPLTFNIDFSPDNGSTWDTAGLFYTGTQAIIDSTNLPAGNLALFRVSASDGIHTTQATSDPFIIHNHLPMGQIVQPAGDITVAVSQTVTFEGQVYDIELGNLDGTNIQWSSSIDGFLGNGALFTIENLSVGTHLISMTADDSQGGVLTDTVTVTVVPTPNELPSQPDELTGGPDPIFLLPSEGVITSTVYLDNLNFGNPLSWNASVDQPWLQLNVYSGTTPQDLTVSTNLSPTDFGTHVASITFTSPDAPDSRVILRVVATLTRYDQYLPVMLK
ncbi:MAG TPA: hypothetical protein VLD65_02645 [Anaerolineales bacterium]|nr:hypothetical protein [Anaerolineales bacterium]